MQHAAVAFCLYMFAHPRSQVRPFSVFQQLQAFEEIVVRSEDLSAIRGLMSRCNAYDANLVDEPDYDARLAAFAQVNEVWVNE